MSNIDLCRKSAQERDTITFGTPEKQVTIDITFIPSIIGYKVKTLLIRDKETGEYTPETLASIVSLFTDEVDTVWIMNNCDYYTLNQIVLALLNKVFSLDSSGKN